MPAREDDFGHISAKTIIFLVQQIKVHMHAERTHRSDLFKSVYQNEKITQNQ